jgi:hypothetical protein
LIVINRSRVVPHLWSDFLQRDIPILLAVCEFDVSLCEVDCME